MANEIGRRQFLGHFFLQGEAAKRIEYPFSLRQKYHTPIKSLPDAFLFSFDVLLLVGLVQFQASSSSRNPTPGTYKFFLRGFFLATE